MWIKDEIDKGCPITGKSFNLTNKESALGPSLDRINNSRGYTKDNTRIVCLWYNLAKWKWNDDFIRKAIKETATFWREKCS